MTFSEYIILHAQRAYLEYCQTNGITPEFDVSVKVPKLCALVKPKLDPQPQKLL